MIQVILPVIIVLLLFLFHKTFDPLLASLIHEDDLNELIHEDYDCAHLVQNI